MVAWEATSMALRLAPWAPAASTQAMTTLPPVWVELGAGLVMRGTLRSGWTSTCLGTVAPSTREPATEKAVLEAARTVGVALAGAARA